MKVYICADMEGATGIVHRPGAGGDPVRCVRGLGPMKLAYGIGATLTFVTLTFASACNGKKAPRAEEVCIGHFGTCARLEDGRVACWGTWQPFVFEADAIRLDCAEPWNKQLCVEDSKGRFACWAAEEDRESESNLSVPPEEMLPLDKWWMGKWWYGGGCGIGADGMAKCWPDGYPGSVKTEHLPDYPVDWIAFTIACEILIDSDGALHARNETEGCTTLEEPKPGWDPHDAYGLDEVPAGSNWRSVAGGAYHACALDDVGQATCWGRFLGEEGAAPTDKRFTKLSAGDESTCGITVEGTIHCWSGESIEDTGVNYWIPNSVPTTGGWVDITMTPEMACAIDVDGQVRCFGSQRLHSSIWDALDNPVATPPQFSGSY